MSEEKLEQEIIPAVFYVPTDQKEYNKQLKRMTEMKAVFYVPTDQKEYNKQLKRITEMEGWSVEEIAFLLDRSVEWLQKRIDSVDKD